MGPINTILKANLFLYARLSKPLLKGLPLAQLDRKGREIEALFHDREFSYRMAPVKVMVKKALQPIELDSFRLPEASEGTVIEMPRWVANILAGLGQIELQEDDINSELFRAVTRERIQTNLQLNPIREDFYLRLKEHFRALRETAETNGVARQAHDRVMISVHDLVTMRIGKILQLSALSSIPSDLFTKVTPEEKMLFEKVRELVSEWRRTLLND